jgi:hypothetical protein
MEKASIFCIHLIYITAIWYMLWPFVNLVAIWYISPVWVYCGKNNLATLSQSITERHRTNDPQNGECQRADRQGAELCRQNVKVRNTELCRENVTVKYLKI